MEEEDVIKIKDIPYSSGPNCGFILHLPDNEGYSNHPITDKYINVLKLLKRESRNIKNFYVVCMGTVHDKIKHIFTDAYVQEMWSRAGNLQIEQTIKTELFNLKDKYKSVDNGDKPMTCNCVEKLYHNVLLPNGDISLCCMDYSLKYIIGNKFI
jgi:hypothetical protein